MIKQNKKSDNDIFYKIAGMIFGLLVRVVGKRRLVNDSVADDIKTLNYVDETKNLVYGYYIAKIRTVLIIITFGLVLTAASAIYVAREKNIRTDYITRADYGQGSTSYDLNMHLDGMDDDEKLSISIDEVKYNRTQFDEIIDKELERFKKKLLGTNSSWNKVDHDLKLTYKFLDHPFNISYYSEAYDVIDSAGVLVNKDELTDDGKKFCLMALITYEGFERRIRLNGIAVREKLDERSRFLSDVKDAVKDKNNNNADNEKVFLPDTVNGKEITWSKQITDNSFLILAMSLVIALYAYINSDSRVHKKVKIRNQKLRTEYPEFVMSFGLLISAGLTPRKAWEKMVNDKRTQKRQIDTQMSITLNEMESGVSERIAYEHFMKRCGLREYTRFVTLLLQEMENGSKGLVNALELESIESYRARRAQARARAEEAGTKLLLPMGLMLIVVLAIIVIPAFLEITI